MNTELEPVTVKSARFGVKQSGGMAWLQLARIYTSPVDPSLLKLERRQFIGRAAIGGNLTPQGSIDVVLWGHDDRETDQPAVNLLLAYNNCTTQLEQRNDGTWEVLTLHLTGEQSDIRLHADAGVWLFENLPAKERDINVRRS